MVLVGVVAYTYNLSILEAEMGDQKKVMVLNK